MVLIYGTALLSIKSIFEFPAASTVTALTTLKLAAVAFLFYNRKLIRSAYRKRCNARELAAAEAFSGSPRRYSIWGLRILMAVSKMWRRPSELSVSDVGVLLIIVLRLRHFKLVRAGISIRRCLSSFSAFSYLSNHSGWCLMRMHIE